MSIDSAITITWDVLKWVVVPIKRQFGYVIYSKRHAQDLQEKVEELADEVDRVHHLVEEARNNLRIVYNRVTEWHASAEKALKEARDLLRDFQDASKTCCYETLPDPSCRYQFSRKAKDKIEVIQRLTQKCREFKELNNISSNPTPGNVAALTLVKDNDVFESRDSIIRDIMDALADDSNSVIGVHGMGGVGKSTLLVDVERRIMEEKSFDWVTKADVSENPDIRKIQGEIADALGLTEIKSKETIGGRAKLLLGRLKNEEREKKKVLIILDNLWKGLDLISVGIPCGHDNKVTGCKLLLTSRFRDVLQSEMGCDRDFRLDELKEEEAKSLFERTVGDKVRVDPFKSLVDEALRKCAGLPFLIITMAKFFKHANFSQWKEALKQIEMSTNKGISERINEMLQLSYNHFIGEDGKEAKSLLRLCVVYGVSKPSLEYLVRYSVGLRLFGENSSIKEARNRLSLLIQTLQTSFLLLDNEDVDGFKIHDLVRGFVTSVASRGDPLLVLKDNDKSVIELANDKLKSCTAVCFPYVDIKELPKEFDCPEMQIFLLFTNNESLEIPDSYFNSMRKLMVLHLSQICLTHSPSSFQFLDNLHTLCFHGCSLEDVAMIGELKGLHILSFVNSKIQRLPKEIGQLVELRLLDLNHCSRLEIIEPGVLGSLMKLEELYMESSFDRWNAMEQTPPTNARLIELNNMKNLCTLHVSILDPSALPEDLSVMKLTRYKICIGDVRLWRSHKGLSTLEIKLDQTSNILQKGYMQTFLSKTDDLYLDGSNGIDQSISALSQEGFLKLKHLHVKNSPSIHYVLQSPSHIDFKTLESLILDNLINLEKICNNHISTKSFSVLKVVRVESCNKMVVLFPLSLLRDFPCLEEVRIVNCHLMREIVEVDDWGKIELHNLHALELRDLPDMRNFLTAETAPSSSTSNNQVGTQVAFFSGQQVAFPSLETLYISDMDNIKIIWDNQVAADSLHEINLLEVWRCSKLLNIVPSCILGRLKSLESLKVASCDLLEVVFKLQPPNPLDRLPVAHLPLKRLELDGLPELKCVWDKELHGQVKFRYLRFVTISGCKSLTSLFPVPVAIHLTQLEELKIYECGIVELIEKEEGLVPRFVFPKLTSLKLQHLMELRCIYTGKYVSHWPALKTLEMCGCHKVEILASHLEDDMPLDKQPLFLVEKVAFPSLETLEIMDMGNIEIIWNNQVAADSFHKLKSLEVQRCHKILNIVPYCILGWLKSLESLEVQSCDLLEVVFKLQPLNPLDGHPVADLPLKKLKLNGLPELKCVWDKELHNQVKFQCLRFVTVYGCKSLTSLFPASVVVHLTQLEELEIDECGIVELIEKEDKRVPRFVFPKLTSLKLKRLTELRCIYIGKYVSHWPALKTLDMYECHKVEILASHPENDMPFGKQPLFLVEKAVFPSLEALHISAMGSIKLILDNHVAFSFPRCFQYLKTLDVSYCDELSNMFTPITVGNLVELTKLRISNCYKLTEVISDEGGKEWLVVAFKQLKYIQLEELRGLTCFSSGRHILMFPLLEDIIVTGCHNIKFFSKSPIRAPKLKKLQGLTGTWCYNGNIKNTIQEMAMDDGVEFMHLYQAKGHSDRISIKPSRQLKSLVVDYCSFFNAIPSGLMGELDKINTLQVQNREQLEEIFGLESLVAKKITQGLPQPCALNLVNLPKLRQLWNKDFQRTLRFNSLSCLILFKCSNLRYAFTPSMVQSLPMLQWMEIKECDQMEEVIREEKGERSAKEKITFPILHWIELECLPNLTAFPFRMNHVLECPVLQELTIARCPKMITFTWQSLIKLDQSIPSHFTPQVIFPHLYSMVLSHMDGSSKIWVHSSQHSRKVEALDKLRVKFCVIKETGLPNVTSYATNQDLLPKLPSSEET